MYIPVSPSINAHQYFTDVHRCLGRLGTTFFYIYGTIKNLIIKILILIYVPEIGFLTQW